MTVSLVEIYMEKVKDLLDTSRQSLSIRESSDGGTYIQDVTKVSLSSNADVMRTISAGLRNRSTSSTRMNATSSRSHCIIIITTSGVNTSTSAPFSTQLAIVDLAGSEKTKQTGTSGASLEEAKFINGSLTALGLVVERLAVWSSSSKQDAGPAHVPYRDSKLTRLLQPALSGLAQTVLILCCSAKSACYNETMSTLRFGMSMSSVKHTVKLSASDMARDKRNSDVSKLHKRVQEAQREKEELRDNMRKSVWFRLVPAHIVISISVQLAILAIFPFQCSET